MKEEILKKLREIQELKQKVTKRVWEHASPAVEIDEDKFNKKGDVLSESAIKQRVKLIAERLIKESPDANPVLISLMDGALPFASLLHDELNKRGYKYTYTSMQASSYGNKMTSGELKIGWEPKILLGGRTVFVIDDVCDTGKTYLKIRELLLRQGAAKVSLVVLVDKKQKRVGDYTPEYVGFEVPADAFIVGMGLDYCGGLRNEREIRVVDTSFLPTVEEMELLNSEPWLNEQLRKLLDLESSSKPGSSDITLFGANKEKESPTVPEHKLVQLDQQLSTATTYQ